MKKIFLFTLTLTVCQFGFTQENTIKLKSGQLNIVSNKQIDRADNMKYYFMAFSAIPSIEERDQIANLGVTFLEYIPNKTYVVNLDKKCALSALNKYGVIALIPIEGKHKLDPKIQNNNFPRWAVNDGKLSIKVLLYKDANISIMQEVFRNKGYRIDDITLLSNSITITINSSYLSTIANMSSVWYIEPIDPPSEKENKTSRTLGRSNTINTKYASGRHYNGEGINIMMQDDGIIGPHIDYSGRIDQSSFGGSSNNLSNTHGDHVAGTIMGSGNLDPIAAGMANAAFLYVYSSSNNNYSLAFPSLYVNDDVVITSKSYSNGCNAGYTSLSQELDQQINSHSSLIHIFSAGNNGSSSCSNPYISNTNGSDWGNVTGGHKQGKNVIAVANLTSTSGLANSSSRGPAADGRIKPDIGAKGTNVNSTVPTNDYDSYTGTSMSCPGIAGIMGQLYQGYKELNGGVNPNSALMKGVLLNSADDLGNPGPDFKHGWGEVNAYQAIKILENNQYLNSSISQGGNNTHNIIVPSGIIQLNVMIYWHDIEGSVNAAPALVNDIDINMTNANGLTAYPWLLDTTANATALNSNATYGNDHINNMEQITINNPVSGNYVLSVNGLTIPFGTQEYWVTYQYITEEVELTYPIGGEGFVPGEDELIRWDASVDNTPFTLEYTTDGLTWNMISNSVGVNSRYYNWTVPNTVTNQAKVRISRNGNIDESDSDFTIIGVPQNVTVNWICPDSIYVSWNTVSGATDYEVSMLGNVYMDSMTTTTATTTLIINPNPAITDSWFSVCAKLNGDKGRRAVAINAQPINIGCMASPLANFTTIGSASCSGIVNFIDASFNQPNYWQWDFGDGTISNQQNPVHTYLQEGTFDVSLFVSNGLGQDSIFLTSLVSVNFMPAPIAYNDTSYVNPATFQLTTAANSVNWYTDTLGSGFVFSGSPFTTPLLSANTTYYVREIGGPAIFGGPVDNTIGSGGFYNNDRHLFLDCYTPSTLISADVYANTSQAITFELRDNNSLVLADTTITVQTGLNILHLGFDVPVMNNLELGMSAGGSDLYRNSTGSAYPYSIGNIASITGHNSPGSATYHYFFYNLKMQENCISDFAEATAVFMLPSFVENVIEDKFSIYPNPATNSINISTDETINHISIFDIKGSLIFSKSYQKSHTSIKVSDFAKGVYTIKVVSKENSSVQQLIIE
ncbi:MAG: S8 family serine peptidase [Flavobacteriales bacterium]|jgi:PKD repeat protein|nr:S8 family serine peptidase [Flavobacteriales bacterium]